MTEYFVGDVRPDGAILTGTGWFNSGTIFVYRFQAVQAQKHGWKILDPAPVGFLAKFGIDLVKVTRGDHWRPQRASKS